MAVHYTSTVVWSFLHAVGLNLAMNAYYLAGPNPVPGVELAVYDNAWDDTEQAIGWGIVLAATYGGICYTAITASGDRGSSTIACPMEDGREQIKG